MTKDEYGDALRIAARNHCHRTRAPEGHEQACLDDLRKEPREGQEWWKNELWNFYLRFFRGEIVT